MKDDGGCPLRLVSGDDDNNPLFASLMDEAWGLGRWHWERAWKVVGLALEVVLNARIDIVNIGNWSVPKMTYIANTRLPVDLRRRRSRGLQCPLTRRIL